MQEFYGFEVQPGKDHKLSLPPLHGFHLSTVSVPHAGKGRGTLYVTVDGKTFAITTLDVSQGMLQNTTDLIFNEAQNVIFRVKGNTTLHCCGYKQELDVDFRDSDDGDDEDDDDQCALPVSDDDDDMDVNDPTQAPQNGLDDEEEDEDDEEEELNDVAHAYENEESDEEEDEDDEEMDNESDEDEEIEEEDVQPMKRAKTGGGAQSQQMQSPQGRPSNGQKSQQMQSPQGRSSNGQKRGRN